MPLRHLESLLKSARALSPRLVASIVMSAAVVLGLWLYWTAEPAHRPAVPRAVPRHPAAAHRAPHKVAAKTSLAKPSRPPPQQPSAYALEQRMGYRALMDRWTPNIREASRRFDVNGQWIRAVMMIESGGRTMLAENRPIVSSAGAMGLMQLMPKTWREMRASYRLGDDPFDPHDNVMAGAAYLHLLYRQYGYPTMFAAYNDGPGMLAAHAALNERLPAETENYVRDIASILGTGVRYRAGSKRNLARLTRPDGTSVMVDAGAVVSVRAALPGEYAPGVQTVVGIGRLRQGVRESVPQATAILRSHGGLI